MRALGGLFGLYFVRAAAGGAPTIGMTNNDGTNSVKVLTITGAAGGTFQVKDKAADSTGPLAWNCSAATLQTAMQTNFVNGSETVTGSNGGPWTISSALTDGPFTFVNNLT